MKKKPTQKNGKPFKKNGPRRDRKPDVNKDEVPFGANGGTNNNDITWYTKYPALVKASSSIIFNHRYGRTYDVIDGPIGSLFHYHNENNIAGVVKLNFRFTIGGAGTELEAINMCAKNLYTYIRHANSGSANYESSDLMQYVLSVLGLVTRLEQLKRDLRLCMTYNPLNRYVYQSVLRTRGYTQLDIDDMVANNALYVGRINAIIAQINTFKIPKDFSIFDKFAWSVTNLFKDDELDKASYYFYSTDDLVHYDWANRKVTFTESVVGTFPAELQKIQTEINNLLNYEDIGIMIGDILKAYKAEGCRVWSPMSIGEVQDSSYSLEVLTQMVNSIAYPITGVLTVEQITANTQLLGLKQGAGNYGVLTTEVSSSGVSGNNYYPTPVHFNPELVMYENEPSSESVIIATRNTVAATLKSDGAGPDVIATITDYTNNLITRITVSYFDENNTLQLLNVHSLYFYESGDAQSENTVFAAAYKLSKFPTLYRWYDDAGDVYHNVYAYGKNNLVVTHEWLKNLHDGCKMSEFSLPMFKLLESN